MFKSGGVPEDLQQSSAAYHGFRYLSRQDQRLASAQEKQVEILEEKGQ